MFTTDSTANEIDLQAFAQRLTADPKIDRLVPASSLRVGGGATGLTLFTEGGEINPVRVTRHAAGQLFGKTAPGLIRLGRDMQEKGYISLLNNVIQRYHEDSDAEMLIRGFGKDCFIEARACLSSSYKFIDSDRVLGAAAPIIEQADRFRALGGNRTQTRDYMKFVEKAPSFDITDDAGRTRSFSAGFLFSNSEVGAGATSFELFVTDHYCNNGIIFSKNVLASARFTHRGSRLTSDLNGFIDQEIGEAENAAMLSGIRNAARKATSIDGLAQIKGLIELANERKVEGRADKVAEVIGERLKLSEANKNLFTNEYLEGGSRTPFGIQAALTAAAQKVDTYDARVELERLGGDVIGYNAKIWDAIESLSAA